MKLFLIHCGYYDEEISNGIYEFHVNIPVVAEDVELAKAKVRHNPIFKSKKMHVDGIQEIETVDGYEIQLSQLTKSDAGTRILSHQHRDL